MVILDLGIKYLFRGISSRDFLYEYAEALFSYSAVYKYNNNNNVI